MSDLVFASKVLGGKAWKTTRMGSSWGAKAHKPRKKGLQPRKEKAYKRGAKDQRHRVQKGLPLNPCQRKELRGKKLWHGRGVGGPHLP